MRRSILLLALLVLGRSASAQPPSSSYRFFQTSPIGAYLRADANDAVTLPTIVDLLNTPVGSWLTLKPTGLLYVAGPSSPQHDAVFCALFSSSAGLYVSSLQARVPGAIPTSTLLSASCVTPPSFYGSLATDIPEDFFVPFVGLSVQVPQGAAYLFVAVPDDRYADNGSPNPSAYGIYIDGIVEASTIATPEPSGAVLLATGLLALCIARLRRMPVRVILGRGAI